MKVLLVNPNLKTVTYNILYHVNRHKFNRKYPPLGLAYLGSILKKSHHDVIIIDANALNLEIDEIIKYSKKIKPDIVGVTCQFNQSLDASLNVAKSIKREIRNIKVILGGPVFFNKSVVKNALKNSFVDFVVIGEGEKTIVELFNVLENHSDLYKIDGIGYKNKNKIIFTRPRQFIKNLNSLPLPAYDLLPMDKYRIFNCQFFTILTSKGCTFNCKFCYEKLLMGSNPIFRSAKNVVDEMEYLYNKFNIVNFEFIDSTFTLKKNHVKNICKEIIKRKLKIKWSCQTRVDLVDDQLLKLMKKAECMAISYGVESGSEKTLEYIGKGVSLKQIIKAFRLTRKNGIYTEAMFMVGLPYENEKEIEKTVEFAKKLKATFFQFIMFTPIEGTPIFEDIKRKRLLSVPNFINYRKKFFVTSMLNVTINTLERIVENPLEIFQIVKDFKNIWY